MQRRVEAKRGRGLRNVVRVAVGDHDCAADPVGRRIGERAAQSSEQLGPFGFGFVARRFDDPQIDVSKRLEPRLEFVARFVRLLGPLADVLALGTVDHQGDNVLQRTPVLLDEIGIAQGEQQERHAQRRAATRRERRARRARPRSRAPPPPARKSRAMEGREKGRSTRRSTSQPFQNVLRVNLVGLVIAGERVHDQIDAAA